MPRSVTQCAQKLADTHNTCEQEGEETEDQEDAERVAEYNALMNEVEEYLTAPDVSTDEIDFKSEVERYLDLIEDKEVEVKPATASTAVVRYFLFEMVIGQHSPTK